MINFISGIGRYGVRKINALGRATIMLFYSVVGKPQFDKNFPQLIQQLYVVGVQSISIIAISGQNPAGLCKIKVNEHLPGLIFRKIFIHRRFRFTALRPLLLMLLLF